jgi:hypothetical protein
MELQSYDVIQDPKFIKLQWLRDRLDDLVKHKNKSNNGYKFPKRVRKGVDADDQEADKPAESARTPAGADADAANKQADDLKSDGQDADEK